MLNKKTLLMAAVVISGTFTFVPVAKADTAVSDSEGSVVEFSEDGPVNAAAAVLVTYENGSVTSLSASSAFGETGAAASANADNALSVGSAVGNGSLIAGETTDDGISATYVNFGDPVRPVVRGLLGGL